MDRLAAMNAFVRVLETGSFSAAARQLRVGQPAVSKAIAQLERRLDVRLLLRTTRGLTATDAGQSFYERAKRAIDEADEAETAARGTGATLTGRLRIGTSITFGRTQVVPHLREFLELHPKIDIEVGMDDRNIDLVEEGVDVAFRLGVPANSTLTGRRIAGCRRLVLATPAHFRLVGEPDHPLDLADRDAVLAVRSGTDNIWQFVRRREEVSVALKGRLRVATGEGVREAVLSGAGFAVASEWLFAPELRAGLVRAALQDWSLPPIQLWGLFPHGRQPTAKARAFVAFIETKLGNLRSD